MWISFLVIGAIPWSEATLFLFHLLVSLAITFSYVYILHTWKHISQMEEIHTCYLHHHSCHPALFSIILAFTIGSCPSIRSGYFLFVVTLTSYLSRYSFQKQYKKNRAKFARFFLSSLDIFILIWFKLYLIQHNINQFNRKTLLFHFVS